MKTTYKILRGSSAPEKPQTQPASKTAPVIFIHGAWGDASQWDNWIEHFDGHAHAISLREDLTVNGKMSVEDYVNIVNAEVITRRLPMPANFVGHSMGGAIVQRFATLWPEKVRTATLLASNPPRLRRLPPHQLPFRFWFIPYLYGILTNKPVWLKPEDHHRFDDGLGIEFGWESGRALGDILYGRVPIKSMNCKTLIVAAKYDKILPVSLQMKIANYHNAEKHVIPGSHMFHCDPEAQRDLIPIVKDWIVKVNAEQPS